MPNLKEQFCEFLLHNEVLLFGNFITKSKRKSPYFLNFGNIHQANALNQLATFFLKIVAEKRLKPSCFFAPAYKGIPLALACCLNYAPDSSVSYSFNRKEEKKHGDKGNLVGKDIQEGERVIIFDDVITAGISLRQSIATVKEKKGVVLAGIVGVDRMEKGVKKSATQEIKEEFKIPIYSIITIAEIIKICYHSSKLSKEQFNIINSYLTAT